MIPYFVKAHNLLGVLSDALLILAVVGAIYAFSRQLFQYIKPNKVATNWIVLLKAHFAPWESVQIFGLYDQEPVVQLEGRMALPTQSSRASARYRQELAAGRKVNDPHAALVEPPIWSSPQVHLKVKSLDYADVTALTNAPGETEKTIALLSATAVIVCPKQKVVVLHRRSANSRTYPRGLHIVGGGYMPPGIGGKHDVSLHDTIVREIHEELSVSVTVEKVPLLCMEEIKSGWIQVAYLGVEVSNFELNRMPSDPNSEEGWPEIVAFADLPKALRDPTWVPTGKAAILAWLALGAPKAGLRPRFGSLTAAELFQEIVR